MNTTSKRLLIFIAAMLTLSGCRFGNYEEKAKITGVTDLMLTTEPTQLATIVFYKDEDADGQQNFDANENTPLAALPDLVANTFTNPVELIHLDEFENGFADAAFKSITGSSSLGALYKADGSIQGGGSTSVSLLWSNPNCLTQGQLSHDQKINFNSTHAYTDIDGKTKTSNGSMKGSEFYQQIFEGDCLDDFKFLAGCYLSPTGPGCTQKAVERAVSLFHLYHYYGGILNFDDATLARIQSLAYLVEFE